MNMLEVADPKVCIIIDFRENGSFASQDLPFPSTALRLTPKEWLASQLTRHRKAFNWVKESQSAIEGLLLMNVERHTICTVYNMKYTRGEATPAAPDGLRSRQALSFSWHVGSRQTVLHLITPEMASVARQCCYNILTTPKWELGGQVVRSHLWGLRVPKSKPDPTEEPPCKPAWCTLNLKGLKAPRVCGVEACRGTVGSGVCFVI
ncbi:hypothetical protein AVEN_134821-1 [Araneus ventricosus]|uniref:Uncharacterized protein n=1 Tax=Araneus ventricosus TaxID=182803 RepID=A0A4Y2JDB8_ARAVE|nr:hypothetical protein AVEN_134821-1 [Araneus ventricosus]